MAKVLVIVPFAFDDDGIDNRRSQLDSVKFGPDIDFDFRGVKAGPAILDCYHDYLLGDVALFEDVVRRALNGRQAVWVGGVGEFI